MKLLLAIAILFPGLALAAPENISRRIEGEEASRLWAALGPAQQETKRFVSDSITIECEKRSCLISLNASGDGKKTYLYRDKEARELYEALNLEEFEGRLGYTKVFSDIETGFEILCSRFGDGQGESFSCSLGLGD